MSVCGLGAANKRLSLSLILLIEVSYNISNGVLIIAYS